MKKLVLLFLVLFSVLYFSQEDTNWYVFYNSDSTKIGYKDVKGNVKIEPKFEPFLINNVFNNVIAVFEKNSDSKYVNYYLNKNGEKFGEDCVYMAGTSDIAEDPIEYEGLIKFRNSKTNNVGFFDYTGKIVINDKYNDITNFHNGIARGLKGAVWPKCNYKIDDCEHIWWEEGTVFAINTKGVELFELPDIYSREIDYSNFKLNENVDSEIYTSYKGSDGNTYSFCNPEKDFNKWFEHVFLPDFNKNKTVLPKYFYKLISVDDNDDPKSQTAWKNHKRDEYLRLKLKLVNKIFENLSSGRFQKNVSWEAFSNNSYYPDNELPKEDLTKKTVISLYCRAKNDYSSANNFQFTKIGNSFYITSAP